MRVMYALRVAMLVLCTSGAHAQTDQQNRAAILQILQASAAAWSHGDLAGFMQSYEDSPDTAYVKNTGVVQGVSAIRDMYASRFGKASGHGMGRLTLQLTQYRQLDPDYALVTGRFALARAKSEGGDAAGVFSLVFHHGAAGWRIIYDHTS